MKKYYVYIHFRATDKTPFYVGISNSVKYKRAYNMVVRSDEWKKISKKEGVIVFIHSDDLTKKDALAKETELIKKYGRIDKNTGTLCNKNDGGCGHFNPSKEYLIKRSDMFKGEKNPNYGKKMSKEQKIKISETMLSKKMKRPMPEYQKNKISESNKGKVKNAKEIINTQTNKVFSSIKECSQYYNVDYNLCWRILNKGQVGLPIKYKTTN
jgi:hypothetical protein